MSEASFPSPLNLFRLSILLTSFSTSPRSYLSTSRRPSQSTQRSPSPQRSASGNFAFRDTGRPRNTWQMQATQLPWYHWPAGMAPGPGRARVWISVHGRERELLSASTCLGNGCLAGLPDLSRPRLSQVTRFSWPSAAAQGHTPVSLIKTQPPTHITHTHTHTHTPGLQLKITLKGTSRAIIPCSQHLFKIHSAFSHQAASRQTQSAGRLATTNSISGCSARLLGSSSKKLHLLLHGLLEAAALLCCQCVLENN